MADTSIGPVVGVTVIGEKRRKVRTMDRATGAPVDRWEVRWRLQLAGGETRHYRRRFDRGVEADGFVRVLQAARVPGTGWSFDERGRPFRPLDDPAPPSGPTMWEAVQVYRSATWRASSANGRKSVAPALRALARLVVDEAPPVPPEVDAYLSTIAFRNEHEPEHVDLVAANGVTFHGEHVTAKDLEAGRDWLATWSLPAAQLTRAHLRKVIARLGHGRAAATEHRRWTDVKAAVRWLAREELVPHGLTDKLLEVRTTGRPVMADHEAIPDEHEMWMMAWALIFTGWERYAALPLVMGGAGLRIGECAELRRKDCVDDPTTGGMWLGVRGTFGAVGRAWTDSGERVERRGTKAKGPDGDHHGRRTYLPPKEAAILRTHLATFVAARADAPVFTSKQGARLEVPKLQAQAWKKARELAFPYPHRLHDLGRHAFRHLAATRWIRRGVPLKTAAKWGGWKDAATMLRWYEAVLPGDDDYSAARMAGS